MKLSDRDLMMNIKNSTNIDWINQNKFELYNNYERLIHRTWHTFEKMMKFSPSAMTTKDDFYSDSYVIAFEKAVDAINLNKILNNDWKFYQYYNFYLTNLRNSYISSVITKTKNETSSTKYSKMTNSETDIVETNPAFRSISAEEEFFKKEVLVAIRTVKQNLLPIQKEILDMKENFENDFQISKKLGIPYSKVRKHLECIRSELSKLL